MQRFLSNNALAKLERLRRLEDNGDGHGSSEPIEACIVNAEDFLKTFHDSFVKISNNAHGFQAYQSLFISADEDGGVVCEWWYENRKLTVDIEDHLLWIFGRVAHPDIPYSKGTLICRADFFKTPISKIIFNHCLGAPTIVHDDLSMPISWLCTGEF